MTERTVSEVKRVVVDRVALDYVLRYIRRYDRLPSDEAPHPFWDAFTKLHASRYDPPASDEFLGSFAEPSQPESDEPGGES